MSSSSHRDTPYRVANGRATDDLPTPEAPSTNAISHGGRMTENGAGRSCDPAMELRSAEGVPHFADVLDHRDEFVAGLQEYRRLTAHADACGCTGEDDVARQQDDDV